MNCLEYILNHPWPNCASHAPAAAFTPREAQTARAFLQSFPEYAPTPLVALPALAAFLGLGRLFVKDESVRFGLKAFKALGSAYAVGRLLGRRLGVPLGELSRERLCCPAAREKLGDMTFVTATDGNHGRGLAWTARRLGQRAVVYLPAGSDPARAEAVRAEGAHCEITELSYDEAVRYAAAQARETGGVLVQDTAWPGYEEIPCWIMQGYLTLALEAHEQMRALGVDCPTHLLLQAGVGSLAGAVLGYFANACAPLPRALVAEPRDAACIFTSLRAGDGRPHAVSGAMKTMMAGLACGEPCSLGWEVLRAYAAAAAACPDVLAADGMRILATPLPGDPPLVSGESGAVTAGLLVWLMCSPDAGAAGLRSALGLGSRSSVLLINTEGDTAPALYRHVLQGGGPDVSQALIRAREVFACGPSAPDEAGASPQLSPQPSNARSR